MEISTKIFFQKILKKNFFHRNLLPIWIIPENKKVLIKITKKSFHKRFEKKFQNRAVGTGGAGGARSQPDFGNLVLK